jgi:WD40 repeat protein
MSTPAAYLPSLDQPNSIHAAPILALRVSANYIVSGSADHLVRVWLKSSGDLALPPLRSYPEASVKTVEVSEHLRLVFSGNGKGEITAWRLSDGERLLVIAAMTTLSYLLV